MTRLVSILTFVFSMNAFADGFVCESKEADLKVEIQNKRHRENGVRNVDYVVLSQLSQPRFSVEFTSKQGTLRNRAMYYTATIDLRFAEFRDSRIQYKNKALSEYEKVYIDVDFTYSKPVENGAKVDAKFWALDRKTRALRKVDLKCKRIVGN